MKRSETVVAIFRNVKSSKPVSGEPADCGLREGTLFAGTAYGVSEDQQMDNVDWLIDPPNGEWICILRKQEEDRYLVLGDPFGYSPVYIAQVQRRADLVDLYVSNSFPAIAAELPAASNHIDEVNVASMLASNSTFTQTVFSQDTPDKRVKLVEQGVGVEISKEGWSLRRIPLPEASYDELISRGIEKARNSLKNVASQLRQHERMQLRLSGGKDSRTVLALLKSSELLPFVDVLTVNPNRATSGFASEILKNDARIANYLRERFNLPFPTPRSVTGVHIPAHESLVEWQRFRSNFNFHFTPRNQMLTSDVRLFDVYGGSGEAFRSHWGAFFRKHPRLQHIDWDSSRRESAAREIFQLVFPVQYIEENMRDETEQRFVNELLDEMNCGLLDSLDRHYVKFRNRGHNGTARSAVGSNTFNLMPMSQVEFYAASRMLPRKDREQGRVIFDVIERTAPELNAVEFESGAWPNRFGKATEVYPQRCSYMGADQHANHVKWINSDDASRGFKAETWLTEQFSQLKAELRNAPELDRVLTGTIDRRLSYRFERETNAGKGVLVAKLASVRDAFMGIPADRKISFDLGNEERAVSMLSTTTQGLKLPDIPTRETLEPIAISVSAVAAGGFLIVDAKPQTGHATPIEFAFYVFAGSERIHAQWYRKDGHLELPLKDISPTRVMAFARFKDAVDAFSTIKVPVRSLGQ